MGSTVKLNTGMNLPPIGFGTWHIFPNGRAKRAVSAALSMGYRLIDTARIYGNESGVGQAVRGSGIPREDIYVTTKLWNHSQGYDKALKAFDNSLKRLGLDYIDLYLIHWPVAEKRLESWRALTEIYKSGRAKAIGVSNYTIEHLEELSAASSIIPSVNQVEFHPFIYDEQVGLLDFCKRHGIAVEAYSPLARGRKTDERILPAIARRHGKTTAQVILRWCVQHGTIPLPKSANPDHIRQNLEIFDFELSADEMQAINVLSDGTRTFWDPTST